MVVGFNHNFQYKGTVYHIQTEDGGLGSPNIVTLLYHGGTILASRKTSYADIIKADHLEKVVEDLMKEQHKGMLRSLRSGEFDDIIARYVAGRKVPESQGQLPPARTPVKAVTMPAKEPPATREPATVAKKSAEPVEKQRPAGSPKPDVAASLDEIVLSYLMGDERK